MKQQTTLEGAIDALRKMKQYESVNTSDPAICKMKLHNVSASGSNELLLLELNSKGYPTEESLKQIRNYKGSHKTLMAEVAFIFGGYGKCEFDGNHWIVATGGWSGCESVISALKENDLFWSLSWYMSKRGGYHEFKTRT